jgi:hypothetical protein
VQHRHASFSVLISHRTTGYALVVDGHFKTEFGEEKTAKKAATELLAKYPMLRIEVYNASSKSRTLVIQRHRLRAGRGPVQMHFCRAEEH